MEERETRAAFGQFSNVEEVPFTRQLEGVFRNVMAESGKRIAGQVGTAISRGLAAASEPLLRRDMGERHFSYTSYEYGFILWSGATLLSLWTGTLIAPALKLVHLYRLGGFFSNIGWLLALLAGGSVLMAFRLFSRESFAHIARIREEGLSYHTRSRGKLRWGDDPVTNRAAIYGGTVVLLLLAPVVGVAFFASTIVSANLAAQQDAAIRERYLDALDAQIEGQFLQDALLGKCDPEITYIYKPLPASMKPELRENIAAAAVGKPVKLVATPPKSRIGTDV